MRLKDRTGEDVGRVLLDEARRLRHRQADGGRVDARFLTAERIAGDALRQIRPEVSPSLRGVAGFGWPGSALLRRSKDAQRGLNKRSRTA